jgi:diguanylate cyclase (GGDEF)-like protein
MTEIKSQITIKHKVHQLGPFVVDPLFATNSYLIEAENLNILIDITPIQILDLLKIAIQKHLAIHELTHIVIQNMTMSHINVLIELIDEGFKGVLVTNRFFARQIINANLPLSIMFIEDIKYKMTYNSKILLNFMPMVFLPYPEMFMTFMPSTNILFSSTLFSSFYTKHKIASVDFIEKQMLQFHRSMMPSSEYTKMPIRRLNQLTIDQIFPLYGYPITTQIVTEILDFAKTLDFYNTTFIYKHIDGDVKEVNYIEIINHMILHLQTQFPRIELLNMFVGTPFSLDNESLQLKKSSLEGYKLWNGFFEHIFIKKGLRWLAILEPKVIKYTSDYGVPLPAIYQSNILAISRQAEELDKKRDELETKVEILTDQMMQSKEKLLRCPITSLYVQDVLKEMLRSNFKQSLPTGKIRGLILVQLNQLNDFNRRYGKETGDEAIRNLNYQIQQVKSEDSTVFKQTGPGILVYLDQVTPLELQQEAVKLRNGINDSVLFIEKVTASISIVSSEEVMKLESDEDKIREFFNLLEKRMIMAKTIGSGEIIDQTSKMGSTEEGMVLLVDEDEISLNMLLRIFKRINFAVIIAQSAVEAMELIRKNPIDVVISEINLSKIDGFALKQMLNETKEFKSIPFVMVSHNKTLDNIKRGNTLDVDLILEKPIIPEELIGHVKRFKDRKAIV